MNRIGLLAVGIALLWGTAAHAADTVYYIHTDALGSPVAMTDANRNVVERTQYAPYGQVLNRPEHDGPGYTGHEEDSATGLTNMQQRYDDKVVGRFLSVDPVLPDGSTGASFNRYAYANDNPYRYTDPDGRCADGTCDVMVQNYGAWANANPAAADKLGSTVGVAGVTAMLAATGAPEAVGVAGAIRAVGRYIAGKIANAVVHKEESTITRYMGKQEAEKAAREGEIPNVGRDGVARPTHVTTDTPVNSAAEAQGKYELPEAPTHRATVPANRVNDLGPTPDGRSVTSGGGSQNATNQPIPVKPDEIKPLDH